jgi:hypothetical protein
MVAPRSTMATRRAQPSVGFMNSEYDWWMHLYAMDKSWDERQAKVDTMQRRATDSYDSYGLLRTPRSQASGSNPHANPTLAQIVQIPWSEVVPQISGELWTWRRSGCARSVLWTALSIRVCRSRISRLNTSRVLERHRTHQTRRHNHRPRAGGERAPRHQRRMIHVVGKVRLLLPTR